jgi:hypothetical protein
MALPGAYDPASIALRVIGAHETALYDKAVVLEEERMRCEMLIFSKLLRLSANTT